MILIQIIETLAQWNEVLMKFKDVDIYYTFEYGRLFAAKENGKLFAMYFEDKGTKIIYPFIRRKFEWNKEVVYDIVTPYGYGGPLLEGNKESMGQFYRHFEDYCKENNIITETIRFHPINKNYFICKKVMDIEYIRQTTAVDLTLPMEEIRKTYTSMNKRNIIKAKREGVFCYLAENTPENIRIFIELYKETMDRNQADSYYYFDDNYFFEQMKNTSISKTYLIFAQYNGEIVAAVMVIIGTKYSHYHLGASKTKYFFVKPNNALFDYMIEFCKSKGSELLHLGGGYTDDDGLFKFKTSFTNNKNFDYYIGKKVYNPKKYNKILDDITGRFKVKKNYFPAYRGLID
ncbi:N-acetyltransferase [Siminovitchia terrae]|uniref:Lipid II:glycine glycyltransferase n=1 Tax=Siminovitchia terrae TaxID=1914933 RepID=A0ABQ4KZD3_SIMTE|nr:GNAT family N-acetyltransferase [Siminovitchia terrae]GIN97383.1 N-acetyltransferase [Siminovitchia terrae]